ncbi:hypothetical protein BHE74_00041837 [Ensete ventricosum]|nr:hypothetical protein BHE74_00041837 [Ensete ventricosum]RZS16986.1 hypothetical protein BHM03_00049070 [Ensete ventricosum]
MWISFVDEALRCYVVKSFALRHVNAMESFAASTSKASMHSWKASLLRLLSICGSIGCCITKASVEGIDATLPNHSWKTLWLRHPSHGCIVKSFRSMSLKHLLDDVDHEAWIPNVTVMEVIFPMTKSPFYVDRCPEMQWVVVSSSWVVISCTKTRVRRENLRFDPTDGQISESQSSRRKIEEVMWGKLYFEHRYRLGYISSYRAPRMLRQAGDLSANLSCFSDVETDLCPAGSTMAIWGPLMEWRARICHIISHTPRTRA